MQQVGLLLAFTLVLWAVMLVGPGIALTLLTRRKRRSRAARRSPLVSDLLRGPGHSLLDEITEAQEDLLLDATLLMVIPLGFMSVGLAQYAIFKVASWVSVSILIGFAIFAIAYTTRKLLKASAKLDRLRAGYDGEVAVGQVLDQLMRQGAYVFHDVPGNDFNIDHVVVSSKGVFSVETKGYTKPTGGGASAAKVTFTGASLVFPDHTRTKPLEQAAWQSTWLAKWLSSATGDAISVLPVLALPGWFVERKGQGAVRVYSGNELPTLLEARGAKALTASEVQRAAHQLEQRCRTVAPRFRPVDEKKRWPAPVRSSEQRRS